MTTHNSAPTSRLFLPVKGQPLPCLYVSASPEPEEHSLQFILLSQPSQKVVIGRDSECTISLNDPAISRSHVSLEVDHSGKSPSVKILNLGTKESKTIIGNRPLDPNVEGRLVDGDMLRLGNTELRFFLFRNESLLETLMETATQLSQETQYEKALGALGALRKHRPVGGLHGTSLERLLHTARYQEACIHAIQGKWNRASELFEELAHPRNPLKDLRIRAAFQLGNLCIQKNDLDQAHAISSQVWEVANELAQDPEKGYFLALVLCLKGMELARRRDLSGAQAAFQQAVGQLQRSSKPSKSLSSRILLEQAIAVFLADQLELAVNEFKRLEEMDPIDKLKVIRAEAMRYRGIILSRRRQFKDADAFLLRALRISQELKWKFLECKVQKSRAINYHSWGRPEEATVHLHLCQKILESEVENKYEHAVVAAHLGKVYLTRGDAQAALRSFEQERSLQTGLHGVEHSQAYTHQNFARAHRNLGHREDATRYYMLAEQAFGTFSNYVPQGWTLVELCRHRLESQDVDGAVADLARAEQCFALAGRGKDFVSMLDTVRAQIAWHQGHKDKALELFNSSISQEKALSQSYFLAETYLIYGRIRAELYRREAQNGNTAAASLHKDEAKRLFDKGIECAAHQSLVYLAEQLRKEIESLDPKEYVKLILSRFVSSEPLDRLINNSFQDLREPLREERTVLFVDLSGYTAMAEREDLYKVRDILNEFYGFATRIIQNNFGTVDKFIGDCVMAFFKSSVTGRGPQNHAIAAVNAAFAIVEEVERLSERRFSTSHRLAASAGICTGEILVGMLGSLQHMNYTCIGDVVNVAARLQGLANPGQVLIAHETYRACMEGTSLWMNDGPKEKLVKNRQKPVQYWIVDSLHTRTAAPPSR